VYPTVETHADESAVVNDLVETLVDGVRGYRTAADAVEDEGLAGVLRKLADERHEVARRLVQVAADAGTEVHADLDGTVGGGLHRAWIGLEGAVTGDESIVNSAIRGEEHALEECEEALGTGIGEPVAAAVRSALVADQVAVGEEFGSGA
jgi:uncharacterized protein (TIGR02284 family)